MPPSDAPHRRLTRRGPRALRATMVAVAMALVASACLPLVSPPTSGRTYGLGPLEAIWEAAEGQGRCAGLTAAELAVMVAVPTYPETGGPVPSPMALGRWDNLSVSPNNARLFSFGQTSGPYVNAYWTAGVGLWQFDPAGGWDLTAADAIDSLTAARQAAATISFRYCNPPSSVARDEVSLRRYSWGPWFGCGSSSGWNCEALYQSMYEAEQIDLGTDASVSRFGGMEQRTCDIAGLGSGLACWYVDPARAQGSTGGWRAGTYDPSRPNYLTPLPKPFYVVRSGGREHRFWIPADTGYDIGITGHKRVTANARTAGELVWERSAPLCDRTAARGACGSSAPSGRAFEVFLRNSATTGLADTSLTFGLSRSAQILMCDWNGDGIDTPGAFDRGGWTVSDRLDGGAARVFGFGNLSGDVAVCGDWDGNGTETAGIFRSGTWYVTNGEGTPASAVFGYGNPWGDVPVVGDWDGNRTDTPGVVRSGGWYLANSLGAASASSVFIYGNASGDVPVVGDWDGNGRDEQGVFRAGWWYLAPTTGVSLANREFVYGSPDDRPLAGRWRSGTPSTPGVAR